VKSFWNGNGVNILRYFPTQAFNFSFKAKFKEILCPYTPDQKMKFAIGSILAGGTAGASTLCLTYPLDYARTRISSDVGKGPKDKQFNGLLDCLKKSVQTAGI
jgi:solute carrier family 25 (adenine nucleotide translocator) protein 4/5/6/31